MLRARRPLQGLAGLHHPVRDRHLIRLVSELSRSILNEVQANDIFFLVSIRQLSQHAAKSWSELQKNLDS